MALDALDPGPEGDYPNWPRLPNGEPDPVRMPRGLRSIRRDRERLLIDVTPRDSAGEPIGPDDVVDP